MFPAATRQFQQAGAAQDVADIAPDGSGVDIVDLLKSLAAKTDPVIEDRLGQAVRQGHYVEGAKALKKSKVMYGNEVGEGGKDHGWRHEYRHVLATDQVKVQYGDRINMKTSFWD